VLLGAATLALIFALAGTHHTQSQGPPLRDFEAYYAAGQTWHDNGDPYGRDVWRTERLISGVVATRDELLPFVGPPFGLPLWATLARLPFRGASIVWAIVLGISFATLTLGSLALAAGHFTWPRVLATVLFGVAFAPLTGGIALGQVALVSCAAIVAMPGLLRPRGTLGAAGAAIVAALQPNLALALAARASDTRARIAFVVAAVIAALGSALALGGPDGLARYAAVLREHGAAERFIAIQTAPGAVAYALGASAATASTFALALAAFVIVLLGVQCWRGRYPPDARLMLACAAIPLTLPFAHAHDYAIAFLPAIVLVVRARGVLWVWAACAALALGIDWLGLAQRPHDIAAPLTLAIAGACALAALAPGKLAPYHAIPFGLVALVALASRMVAQHTLPVWPDALPSDFHVAAKLPAAVVWAAEQAASGIAVRDQMWGALRAVGLIACAILWSVASIVLRERRVEAAIPSGAPATRAL